MDFRQLRYFLNVAEMQSLSRAASVLRVAQPALSRQIKGLEDELGVPLLRRHGWGVTPTPAGRVLMDHARLVLKEVGAARDAVLAYQSEPSGTLSFGVPSSLSKVLLPGLAVRFRQRAPKVRLHMVDGFSATIHEWLVQGRLDLAVLYDSKTTDGLVSAPLLDEEMVLVGAAGQLAGADGVSLAAVSLADVAARDLILPGRPHRLRLLVEQAFAEQGLSCEPVIEVDALSALIELVRIGEAYTLLPLSAVHGLLESGELSAAVVSPPIRRSLVLARPQGRVPTPAIEALERTVVDYIHTLAAPLGWNVRHRAFDVEETV